MRGPRVKTPVALDGAAITQLAWAPSPALALVASRAAAKSDGTGGHDVELVRFDAVAGWGVSWQRALPGASGVSGLATSGSMVGALVRGTDALAIGPVPIPLTGDPGAALVRIDLDSGQVRGVTGFATSAWVTPSAIAAFPENGWIVVGSFAGTLRIGAHVVSAAGPSDGFAVAIDASGRARWLVRMGGDGADGLARVAGPSSGALGEASVVVAGTFTGHAQLGRLDLRTVRSDDPGDGVVARLDANGQVVWAQTWASPGQDGPVGVAQPPAGVVVVATVRDGVIVGGEATRGRGQADVLVWSLASDGTPGVAQLIGGEGDDTATAFAHDGQRAWIGGVSDAPLAINADDLLPTSTAPIAWLAHWTDGSLRLSHQLVSAGPTAIGGLTISLAGSALWVDADGRVLIDRTLAGAGAERSLFILPPAGP